MNFDFTKLFQDIPAVINTVDTLVVSFEQKGNGEAKKNAVLNTLGSLYDVAGTFTGVHLPPKAQVLQFAEATVNTLVAFKNNSGEFAHEVVAQVEQGAKTIIKEVESEVGNVVHEIKQDVQNVIHPQA